jgi:RNA polymerase sigma factor for flagellar operon FliA
MYYLDDMRMKEIGEVLNLSESRVSRLIAAAELQIKSIVKRRSGE